MLENMVHCKASVFVLFAFSSYLINALRLFFLKSVHIKCTKIESPYTVASFVQDEAISVIFMNKIQMKGFHFLSFKLFSPLVLYIYPSLKRIKILFTVKNAKPEPTVSGRF